MSNMQDVFKDGHKALVAYIMAGYPSEKATLETVPMLEKNGVDIVEIGIPFSDPLADGATIQKAGFEALQNGTTVESCLQLATKLKRKVKTPLAFMTYYNPVMSFGIEKFCSRCSAAGISGLIIPDLPPEEAGQLDKAAKKCGLDTIFLVTPNTTAPRIKEITGRSSGFVYLVSVTGITGARKSLPTYLRPFVTRVRKISKKPLCIGFGISTPSQAAEAARMADGVIIGSKIVQLMGEKDNEKLRTFIRDARIAIDRTGKVQSG
jgi:tryptophan synthase alpha chain